MKVLVFTALVIALGHATGCIGVAQGVEEGKPEEGVAGLVAVAIPDQGSEDNGDIHHA